jgi:hypothetical protein
MKKMMMLSILLFSSSQMGMPCMADTAWEFAAYHLCYNCWDFDYDWYKYVYTSTDLYTPPDNKEIKGWVSDDRRCKSTHNSYEDYTWTESYGEEAEVAHSWQTTYGISSSVLGLSAGVTHQNDWSWACNLHIGESRTTHVNFTTPYGEYGKHYVEWACEGTKYEGCFDLEVFHEDGKIDKCWTCSEHLNDAATDQRKERVPIATAGDWYCWSKSCDDGCGWEDQKCNGCSCSNPACDHN